MTASTSPSKFSPDPASATPPPRAWPPRRFPTCRRPGRRTCRPWPTCSACGSSARSSPSKLRWKAGPLMNEVSFVVSDADDGLRERLDEEINLFNAAVTGYHDARLLYIAVGGGYDDLHAGLYGSTWGGCGYIDVLWVRADQLGSGLGTRLLAAAEKEIQQRGCDR